MKLSSGDTVKVHGHLDLPLEDGFTYVVTGSEGERYVFECKDTGVKVQVPYPAVDRHLGRESFIERI